MKNFIANVYVYLVILLVGGGVIWEIASTPTAVLLPYQDFSQPAWGTAVGKWRVRSIDTQVVSRHWENVPRESIATQIDMLSQLGTNYVAIATPYDRDNDMKMWVEEIHNKNLNVWFRCHWNEWEGDDKAVPSMTPQQYLDRTYTFITTHKDFFKPGDAFTVAVEPEQVGVGLGKRFGSWDEYRTFVLNQILIANKAFSDIGMSHQIHTNWISTNGWVVKNQFTQEFVDKIGLITVDHYPEQTQTIGESDDVNKMVGQMSDDLDKFYKQWQKPILIGEWGYQIHQEVSDQKQAAMIGGMMAMMSQKPYIVGVNYWVHMGHYSRIIGDRYGSDLKFRPGAEVLGRWYINMAEW